MALVSDTALQTLKLKKQESSLQKVHKYEQIADKLISSDLPGKTVSFNQSNSCALEEEREKLKNEYKLIKNQLNFHLIPLKQQEHVVSWNSMILKRNSADNGTLRLPEINGKNEDFSSKKKPLNFI
jgi:hypothetical protein